MLQIMKEKVFLKVRGKVANSLFFNFSEHVGQYFPIFSFHFPNVDMNLKLCH